VTERDGNGNVGGFCLEKSRSVSATLGEELFAEKNRNMGMVKRADQDLERARTPREKIRWAEGWEIGTQQVLLGGGTR